jgi:cell division protease FtsH
MSDKIGPVAFRQSEEHPFLGKEMHSQREFSDETARLIDVEVQHVMQQAQNRATEMLNEYRAKLDQLAEALLENETLERAALIEILGPRPGNGDDSTTSPPDTKSGDAASSDAVSTEPDSD